MHPNPFLLRYYTLRRAAFCLFIALLTALSACRQEGSSRPDVSGIDAPIQIRRFERDLFALSTDARFGAQATALQRQYPDFYGLFVSQIMGFGEPNDTARTYPALRDFIQNPDMRFLYDTCMQQYPDLSGLEADFSQAFRYVKHYLPATSLPQVVSHISAFGPAAVTIDDELIGINLDMYMGSHFPLYQTPDFPAYLTRRFQREYIVPNTLKAYIKGIYTANEQDLPRLIDHIAYEGKLLYFLDQVLPDTPDSLKIGYGGQDLAWCAKNEAEIWAFLIDQELLFNTQSKNFYKYLDEAPHTSGMPAESPGRVPIWVGWQMVRRYMQAHPNTTFEQLMALKDGQALLKAAKYKPK